MTPGSFWLDQWAFWGHWQATAVSILCVVSLITIGVGFTEWWKWRR